MAHDDRSDPRRSGWGRETQWQGDDSFGGGWGNQIARPERGYDPQNVTPQGALFGADARGGEFARPRHDPHYSEWRQRQIDAFDRDYDDYVRENQSRFDREFGAWREERGRQRDAAARVREHMEVVGADGGHVGIVDKVRGEGIILTRSDDNAGGVHHRIPCAWIADVDTKVTLTLTAAKAMAQWREEGRSRALFEREDSGSDGPHMLNRSFAGTYSDKK